MNLFETIALDRFDLYLTRPLEAYVGSKYEMVLRAGYRGSKEERFIASWLNATLTQRRVVSIWSTKSMAELMQNDVNLEHKSLDGDTYKKAVALLLLGTLRCLRPPSKWKDAATGKHRPGVPLKSGVYEVIDPQLRQDLLVEIGEERYQAQCKVALAYYDEIEPDPSEIDDKNLR